ncbi:MAG: hypothetical protein R6V03_08985 [Kiritimatiellia bacterium]
MTDKGSGTVENNESAAKPRAVMFELETCGVDGRKIIFDVLKSVLKDKGIELTPVLFQRYCLSGPVRQFLPALLEGVGKKRVSEEKLAGELEEGIRLSLRDGSVKARRGIKEFVTELVKRGVSVGAVSRMDKETVDSLAGRAGLSDSVVRVKACSVTDREFPGKEDWEGLAEEMSVEPVQCLAIATDNVSCRNALKAQMKCAVIADEYTAYQDFGGADLYAEDLNDQAIKDILGLL